MEEVSSTPSAQATNQVETVNVRVVTRSKSKQQSEKQLQVETAHVNLIPNLLILMTNLKGLHP